MVLVIEFFRSIKKISFKNDQMLHSGISNRLSLRKQKMWQQSHLLIPLHGKSMKFAYENTKPGVNYLEETASIH